jgi:hypothetical protein
MPRPFCLLLIACQSHRVPQAGHLIEAKGKASPRSSAVLPANIIRAYVAGEIDALKNIAMTTNAAKIAVTRYIAQIFQNCRVQNNNDAAVGFISRAPLPHLVTCLVGRSPQRYYLQAKAVSDYPAPAVRCRRHG